MKKIVLGTVLSLVLFMLFAMPSLAAVTIEFDGRQIPVEEAPRTVQGRLYVPMRVLSDALSCAVIWEENTVRVHTGDDIWLATTVGAKAATVTQADGSKRQVTLDVPAKIYGDRLLLPLRAVAEALGVKVDYRVNKVSLTSTPLYFGDKPLTCMTEYKQATMGGNTFVHFGNANIARAYRIFTGFKQREAAAPAEGEPLGVYAGDYKLMRAVGFYSGRPTWLNSAFTEPGLVNYRLYAYEAGSSATEKDMLLYDQNAQKWYAVSWADFAASGFEDIWTETDLLTELVNMGAA